MIRRATIADAAAIAAIGKISFIESHGHSASQQDIDYYISQKYTTGAMEAELSNDANIYHLIYSGNQLAGYSKIILNAANENIAGTALTCLDRLYLLKEFYGKRLGERLLNHNIQLSKQAQQTGMWLYTWVENSRAVAFYLKAGFRIVGAKDFRISATHSNPNHVMWLSY